MEVSRIRSRAVKMCWAVGRVGEVQVEAENPALEVRGGMP